MLPRRFRMVLSTVLLLSAGAAPLFAGSTNRIAGAVSQDERATISHSVDRRALLATDNGVAEASLVLKSMKLRFNLSDAGQAALTQLLLQQQQPASVNYHKWLTPEQYAAQFGLSASDLSKVSAWLAGQGFTITGTARSKTFISFSGTAAQVQHAFGTTIHAVTLDGAKHYTNLTDPSVPAALSGVVAGVSGLHDFKLVPHSRARLVPAVGSDGAHPEYTSNLTGSHFVAPGDFYTIYDEAPLLASAINGSGITIAVMGQTDISLGDVAAFRSASGLAANAPTVQLYGPDPGTSSDDLDEAQLDVEWSGAAAPSASILYVNSTQVLDTSLTEAIDNDLAPIMTISYGECEAGYTLNDLKTFNLMFQQANAQGITILGPAGDSGAADCDFQVASATNGLAVDFPASSPFVTGLGGTMFNEGSGTYWATTNDSDGGSALSYIPEAVWNESSSAGLAAGGGGASATFTKPAWQVGTGVPNDFSRDVPDVSLNAGADHDGYLFCSSGSCVNGFRTSTTATTSCPTGSCLNVVGGTSVSTPSFAGLMALVEQKIDARIGNANPTLYGLANSTYYANIFNDVTTGSNAVPCTAGSTGCASGGTIGYTATAGYDLATGWGSVDSFNLVNDWLLVPAVGTTAGQTASATTVTTTTGTVTAGTAITFTATVASGVSTTTTTPTGTIQLLLDGTANGTTVALVSGSATLTLATTGLTSGTHVVMAVYSGDGTYQGSKGTVSVDITSAASADFSLTGSPSAITVAAGGTSSGVTFTVTSLNSFAGSVALTASTASSLNASGQFSVTPVTLTAGSTGMSVFTFYAFVSNSASKPVTFTAIGGSGTPPWELAGGGVAFASLLLLVFPKGRRRLGSAGILSVMLLSVGAVCLTGCGSAGGGTTTTTTTSTTNSAAGTYVLTITGTSGTLSHSTTLTVTVQ